MTLFCSDERWTMHQKILVPLDGSEEAERVIGLVRGELAPKGAFILLRVVPPSKNLQVGDVLIRSTQQEEADQAAALDYLSAVAQRQNTGLEEWCFKVPVSSSAADGIVNVAQREEVDLIAMYTRDRRGLARLIKGSIANKVKEISPVEVRTFTLREAEAVGS
jgi:nucleotide-binding universal stress UspA family protein